MKTRCVNPYKQNWLYHLKTTNNRISQTNLSKIVLQEQTKRQKYFIDKGNADCLKIQAEMLRLSQRIENLRTYTAILLMEHYIGRNLATEEKNMYIKRLERQKEKWQNKT